MPFHPPSSTPSLDHVFQVVVMRVSLHCQGCAGKVKKHLSKMEGVTSFSIDLETKRVTVMGHVSPSGVLESISKVKKAELWSC
ncbi:protein SODIUM POTASSIUM ROOT DEFECTIVE 1-like [Vitis riparia]|nr:protein SODIUM POTASSIUM ROOT DEFECTIVE 1-like [Vitis riparia]